MIRRTWLKGIVAGVVLLVLQGCKEKPAAPSANAVSELVQELSRPSAERRLVVSATLAEQSSENLKPVVAELESAVAKERDPFIRSNLQKALRKARGQ